MARKTYSGAAASTTLNGGITNVATTIVVADGSSYPSPSVAAPMVIVVGPETATEEQILISGRSGNTLTVATSGRNYHLGGSGTGVAHDNGEVVRHVLDYQTVEEANAHVNDTTRDDHTQYHTAARHAAVAHTSAMISDLTVATADIADSAVTTAKINDGAVTTAKLAAATAAGLCNFDVFDTETAENPLTTAYKLEAGSTVISFTGGNGTLVFPTAFPTAILALVISNGDATVGNYIVLSVVNSGLGLNQSALVAVNSSTLAGITGLVRVEWFALGY